jgi:DNA polymerase III subunit alpha
VQDKDLNKKSLESLIKCGAFDSLGSDRGVLLANIENILAFHKETHEQAITKQNSLFSGSAIDLNSSVRIEGAPKATADEKLIWEKELLGLYVTAHPFKPFQDLMGKVLTPLSELDDLERKKWVVVGGIIDKTKKKITRSGKAMMFVNIQDTSGIQELLVFPKTYETTKDVWAEGKIVCVLARTSEEEGDDKLFVERAYELTKNNAKLLAKQFASTGATVSIREYVSAEVKQKLATGVEIKLSKAEVKEKADNIKSILKKYPGDTQVYLVVDGKKIKTSYLVDCRDELKKELEVEVGGSRVS